MAEAATGNTISVICPCGKKLKAPATAVGKKAKCPQCGNVLTVTAPKAAAARPAAAQVAAKTAAPRPAAKPAPPPQDDSLDALYDLAQQGQDESRQVAQATRCPQCRSEMAEGAVLCIKCGYDTRTGKAITPTIEKPSGKQAKPGKAGKVVEDKMAPQGSYLKGIAGSAVGASIGGGIWLLVAWGTGFEFYILALLVGILAGLGMQWGHEGYSYKGGFAATGITFIVLMLAKVAVVFIVLMPAMRDGGSAGLHDFVDSEDGNYDDRVVALLAEDQLKSMHIKAEDATPDQEKVAYAAAKMQLKKMSKKEYDAAIKRADEHERLYELIGLEAEEIMRGMPKPNNIKDGFAALATASKRARAKVEAMTPQQREAEMKRLGDAENRVAEIDRQRAANDRAAEMADSEGSSGSTAAKTAGIVVLLLLIFGWKSALFMIGALVIAFRTAAGSQSD